MSGFDFYDAMGGLGPPPQPVRTPPFRLPTDMVGPMPPVGMPVEQMPPMTEEEALMSEEGYYGPPVRPQPKRQGRRQGRKRRVTP